MTTEDSCCDLKVGQPVPEMETGGRQNPQTVRGHGRKGFRSPGVIVLVHNEGLHLSAC